METLRVINMKNKQFEKFLKNRPENKKPWCFHDKDHWCTNCIAIGQRVDARGVGLGQGTVFSNVKIK